MKNQRGFIQIPILVAIIIGVVFIGGTSYMASKKSNVQIVMEYIIPSVLLIQNLFAQKLVRHIAKRLQKNKLFLFQLIL